MNVAKTKQPRSEAVAQRVDGAPWDNRRERSAVPLSKPLRNQRLPAPLAKAKKRDATVQRPARAANAEVLDRASRMRFEEELDAALKRRPAGEAKLAGALRAVAQYSPSLRASLGEATALLLRRGTLGRELFACGLRALAEAQDRQVVALLRTALAGDEAGGPAALSAACFSRDPELSPILSKVAASRHSHLAFGAELARVARGESNGTLLVQLAPKIKESHRIALCTELFVPLARALPVAANVGPALSVLRGANVGPALSVLRGAERHLGRWLLLAEVAVRAGDASPIDEARVRSGAGPNSSRVAWSLVAWALAEADAAVRGTPAPPSPATRPTLELIARLSDRPSADRDTTFLFRMAGSGAASVRPMLEAFVRTRPLANETSLRAALYLIRNHGRGDLCDALAEAAGLGRREDLRGLAAAALWDAGAGATNVPPGVSRERATGMVDELLASRVVGNVAWGSLIRGAAKTPEIGPLVAECPYRWIQWGWIE